MKDLTALSSPRPRDLREAARADQSSRSTENSLIPASPPYTNRSGRCRIWLKESARSVASTPRTITMAGMPTASMRTAVATARVADLSLTTIIAQLHQTSPPVFP